MNKLSPQPNKIVLLFASALFIGAGLIALFVAFYSSSSEQSAVEMILKLTPDRGGVLLSSQGSTFRAVSTSVRVTESDTIETDDIGQAWLELGSNQGTIKILESSKIKIARLTSGVLIRILNGNVRVNNAATSGRVAIQLPDGEIKSVEAFNSEDTGNRGAGQPHAITTDITPERLELSVEKLRPQVLKCYSNFLTRIEEKRKWSILVKISYSGREGVKKINLMSNFPIDQGLENCLRAVLSTLNLAPYRGPLIDIEFPIELD